MPIPLAIMEKYRGLCDDGHIFPVPWFQSDCMILNTVAKMCVVFEHERFELTGYDVWMTAGELATALRVGPRALRDYRNSGILPYIRLKGNIVYKESDIEKVLSQHYKRSI